MHSISDLVHSFSDVSLLFFCEIFCFYALSGVELFEGELDITMEIRLSRRDWLFKNIGWFSKIWSNKFTHQSTMFHKINDYQRTFGCQLVYGCQYDGSCQCSLESSFTLESQLNQNVAKWLKSTGCCNVVIYYGALRFWLYIGLASHK